MNVDLHAFQFARHGHGVVATAIVHEDDVIHDPLVAHLIVGLAHGFRRIVGRHDDDHFLSAIHDAR